MINKFSLINNKTQMPKFKINKIYKHLLSNKEKNKCKLTWLKQCEITCTKGSERIYKLPFTLPFQRGRFKDEWGCTVLYLRNQTSHPDWGSSVDWAPAVNERATGSIPGQGTSLGCGPGPQWGHKRGNHMLIFLSLSFSLPSPLSKNK